MEEPNEIILIWENIPESIAVYTGAVDSYTLGLLKRNHRHYINSVDYPMTDELKTLCCYDDDGEFVLPPKLGLRRVEKEYASGVVVIMGVLL